MFDLDATKNQSLVLFVFASFGCTRVGAYRCPFDGFANLHMWYQRSSEPRSKRGGDPGGPDELGQVAERLVQVHRTLCIRGNSQLHSMSQNRQDIKVNTLQFQSYPLVYRWESCSLSIYLQAWSQSLKQGAALVVFWNWSSYRNRLIESRYFWLEACRLSESQSSMTLSAGQMYSGSQWLLLLLMGT